MVEDDKNLGRFGEYPEWTWIKDNWDFLREKYEGKWIAVAGQEVLSVADEPEEAIMAAKDFTFVFIHHCSSPDDPMTVGRSTTT